MAGDKKMSIRTGNTGRDLFQACKEGRGIADPTRDAGEGTMESSSTMNASRGFGWHLRPDFHHSGIDRLVGR
jgi:hypothetical protein